MIALADGTRIAYAVEGQGPALMLTNGLTTTNTFWKYLKPAWCERYTVVTWDMPGHGRSGPARSPESASIPMQPKIMAAIMEAEGIHTAIHVGFSVGCQVILELYRQCPARCAGLALVLGGAQRVLSSTALPFPGGFLRLVMRHAPERLFALGLRSFARLAVTPIAPPVGRALGLIGRETTTEDAFEFIRHMATLDPASVRWMALSGEEHSAWDVLPQVRVPLLIIAGDQDPLAPVRRVAIPMHLASPHSELLRLPRGTHTALLDHADAIGAALAAFFERIDPRQRI